MAAAEVSLTSWNNLTYGKSIINATNIPAGKHSVHVDFTTVILSPWLYLSTVAFDEWKKQIEAYMIDYNALKIEETVAKGYNLLL